MNIFIVGGGYQAHWLDHNPVFCLKNADIVMFTGGADVTPTLYTEPYHKQTNTNGNRDAKEISYFNRAVAMGKKMIGICRGAQFLTVMNGGKLIQHVTGHGLFDTHEITSPVFGEAQITSTHHQMMYPFNLPEDNYELIAYSTNKRSDVYENGFEREIELPDDFVEPEIVYYPKTQSLGIQGHPEHMDPDSDDVKYCKQIVEEYLYD